MRASNFRRLLRLAGILGIGLAALIVVLACVGAAYQWVALHRDRRMNPPPGRLVDVGGYRMHLVCTGQDSPTVLLESGLGDTWLAWCRVQGPVAQFTRVCSYDRAGLGWSDPSPLPRTSRVIAEELHSLLHHAGIAGPFVLVGHSFGGMNVRMYASLHRSEVAGVVLVDSSHPDQDKRLPPELDKSNADFIRKQTLLHETMLFGLSRLMGWCGGGPPEIRSMLRTVDCRLGPWREHLAEECTFLKESQSQVRASGLLGDIPLVVLSHDPDKAYAGPGFSLSLAKEMNREWDAMQDELARLSTNGSRSIARGCGHMIHQERPEMVIEAVRKLVEQSRTRSTSMGGSGNAPSPGMPHALKTGG